MYIFIFFQDNVEYPALHNVQDMSNIRSNLKYRNVSVMCSNS